MSRSSGYDLCFLFRMSAMKSRREDQVPWLRFFVVFPSSFKKLEASSLNHDHVLHRVRVLAMMAYRGKGYYYYYFMAAQIHAWSPIVQIILRKSHHFRSETPRSNKALKKKKKRNHTFLRELPNIADARSDILTAKYVTITVLPDVTLLRFEPIL
jgi:hypothetical protein